MIYMRCYINCKPDMLDTAGAVLIANDIAGYIVNDPNNIDYLYSEEASPWDYIEDQVKESIAAVCNVEFYLPQNEQGKETLNIIKAHIDTLDNSHSYQLGVAEVDDSTWINKWKEFFKPLKIGERFYVKPSWEDIREKHNRCIIEIDPENSFGSGTHATTQLCLSAIEHHCLPTYNVLDLGCGSGILGIGCKLLGCSRVTFVDIDSYCIETSKRNSINNGLDPDTLQYYYGNILVDDSLCQSIGYGEYDIVLMNIMVDINIAMAPIVHKFLSYKGVVIFSGIISQRLDDMIEALKENDYKVMDIVTLDNWCSVVATR